MIASVGSDSPSDVERVRLLYRETLVPVDILAACLGVERRGFYRRLDEWAWPRRNPERAKPSPRDRPPLARAKRSRADPREGTVPREGTARAMERFIAERLAALQADAVAGRDADPERTARTVAQYARALQTMQATRARSDKEQIPDEAEPPARSLSELRDELRGHLERIWDETRARRRARKIEPDAG